MPQHNRRRGSNDSPVCSDLLEMMMVLAGATTST